MSSAALTFSELLQYTESEYSHWREWFKKNPAALEVKTDIAETTNVRQLLLHIIAVDLRYAERLLGEDVTTYDKIPTSCEGLFGTADVALKKMQRFVAKASDQDWQKKVTFSTMTAGTQTASKRKCFVHTLFHGARHWAQLASILRAAGFKQDWRHDFLFTDAMQ
jgi:uncharacterized damage-inducible protein DinB